MSLLEKFAALSCPTIRSAWSRVVVMQNTDFFDIMFIFLWFVCVDESDELIVAAGRGLDFQLVVHISGARDPAWRFHRCGVSPSAVLTGPRKVTWPFRVMIFTFWAFTDMFFASMISLRICAVVAMSALLLP